MRLTLPASSCACCCGVSCLRLLMLARLSRQVTLSWQISARFVSCRLKRWVRSAVRMASSGCSKPHWRYFERWKTRTPKRKWPEIEFAPRPYRAVTSFHRPTYLPNFLTCNFKPAFVWVNLQCSLWRLTFICQRVVIPHKRLIAPCLLSSPTPVETGMRPPVLKELAKRAPASFLFFRDLACL